jgi:hypothetical protein
MLLLVLVSFALIYGCEQASSPVEHQEKQAGMEEAKPEEPTPQRMEEAKAKEPAPQPISEPAQPVVVGNIPIAGIVGEKVKGSSFDLRVLDYFSADHYYYAIDRNVEMRCTRGVCHWTEAPPYIDIAEEATSQAGRKFVVVNYSVTNTSSKTVEPTLSAQLHVRGADGKTQVYKETDDVRPPIDLDDIAPQGLRLAQFVFDVPKEVEPELVAVAKEAEEATASSEEEETWVVDLRESYPQGPRPEEILALQYEYFNMADYERVYDLFAQESKDRVSEGVYVSFQRELHKEDPGNFIPSYSFPSVEIEGERATIQVVIYSDAEGEGLVNSHRDEAVLEELETTYTIDEAAEILGESPQRVREMLLYTGELDGNPPDETVSGEWEVLLPTNAAEDKGWRIVMHKGEYIHAECWETMKRLC